MIPNILLIPALFLDYYDSPTTSPIDTTTKLTELMMEMTNGIGCAENQFFSMTPLDAFCCQVKKAKTGGTLLQNRKFVKESHHVHRYA